VNASFRSILVFGLLVPSAVACYAQGFAGLGSTARGFAIPKPGLHFQFPADHAPHPDFRIEWWYVTANLKGNDGLDYGVQWTLFRSAAAPGERDGWSSPQVWMGNAAITTPDRQFSAERLARGEVGQAGVTISPFDAWIDEWALRATSAPDGSDQLSELTMSATGADFGYQLNLEAEGPVVSQGDNGYSVKSAEGQASYYYSQPFYSISGTLQLPDKKVEVNGKAWLDREWSSQPLAANQKGWDWFSLHFDDGSKMMGFRLRDTSGGGFTSGTWIFPDGRPMEIAANELRINPLKTASVRGRDVPVQWRLQLPSKNLDIMVSALNNESWVDSQFPYWEGPIRISGNHAGVGYLEMTGY
jgi:predicted secreted hydrolase